MTTLIISSVRLPPMPRNGTTCSRTLCERNSVIVPRTGPIAAPCTICGFPEVRGEGTPPPSTRRVERVGDLRPERRGALGDDGAALRRLGLALREVLLGDGRQVVEVVEEYVGLRGGGRIDVARQGEVDQEQRARRPGFHGGSHRRRGEDAARGGGR